MYAILPNSGLSFMYKMIREIISMPRADSVNLHNFGVNPWVFKNDLSKIEAKTNSEHRVCQLLVGSLLFAHYVYTRTHSYYLSSSYSHTDSYFHSTRIYQLTHRHTDSYTYWNSNSTRTQIYTYPLIHKHIPALIHTVSLGSQSCDERKLERQRSGYQMHLEELRGLCKEQP